MSHQASVDLARPRPLESGFGSTPWRTKHKEEVRNALPQVPSGWRIWPFTYDL